MTVYVNHPTAGWYYIYWSELEGKFFSGIVPKAKIDKAQVVEYHNLADEMKEALDGAVEKDRSEAVREFARENL